MTSLQCRVEKLIKKECVTEDIYLCPTERLYACLLSHVRFFVESESVDCSPPGSSVHGISQARIPEGVAISYSRGSSDPGIKPVSLVSPAWQVDSLPLFHLGSPLKDYLNTKDVLRSYDPLNIKSNIQLMFVSLILRI